MTTLPPLLQPWTEELNRLPEEVATAVGPWLPRLSMGIGPLRGRPTPGDGEPDGFDGLSRRGSYERLLISEWALAEEAPLEFLRRAAEREQLFFKLRRLEPAGTRRSVVLLDCGPLQLGGPRLAQLAALIVFARRAAAADAEFAWGVLQDGNRNLRPFDEATLRSLAASRTLLSASEADAAGWADAVDEEVEDLWVVGSRHAPLTVPRARWLTLDEQITPTSREILARTDVEIALALPDPEAGARLLRELKPASKSGRRFESNLDPECGLRFSQDGHRLLGVVLRGDARELRAWHVPDNSRAKPGKPRHHRLPDDRVLVGAAYIGKQFVVVTEQDDQLALTDWAGHRDTLPASLPSGGANGESIRQSRLRPMIAQRAVRYGTRARWSIACADEVLHFDGSHVVGEAGEGLFVVPLSGARFLLATAGAAAVHLAVRDASGAVVTSRRFPSEAPPAAFSGFPGHGLDHPEWGLFAFREAPHRWRIHFADQHEKRQDVPMRVHDDVVGVARDFQHAGLVPGLLCLDGPRLRLTLHRISGGSRVLASFPSPVRCFDVSALRPHVAALLESGELRVRSIQEDRDLLVVHPEAP